ncbi:hypothetical protein [Streptomyces mirabilis]|uniref:hypothetical protein n=1 Tax=Streptomyces mirabilis TaxID=68239 RepID=UPI0033EECC8A
MDRTPQRHAESLLNALDPLPFPQRMRELALRVKERTPLRPVLEELESRGPYERGIAAPWIRSRWRPRRRRRRSG